MIREVFVVKNNTISDLVVNDFGLIISSGSTIDLGDYDKAIMSDEIDNYLSSGDLIRVINGSDVSYEESFNINNTYSQEIIDSKLT